MPDAGTQDGPDRSPQGLDLDPAQGRRPPRGPDAGAKKGFIRIDVSDPGDLALIQEKRLEAEPRTRGRSARRPRG